MVTLRRPPQILIRKGPQLEPYQVVLRPLVTEKSTYLSERFNAYTFEVNLLASKTDIKKAVEDLYQVKVVDVRVQNRAGKAKRFKLTKGRRRNWKKAIVALDPEYRIDFY
ncbi:LSU ribosomal protein L23P [Isosphaera pallida ATCC 43644]|uniref:Large ribosomal subunit protein uL23 n=1 Tax=Isosphaera pallida (strain ATCC 43644 / DSM 9630 / IS1B) TaxID=575540 RepID=E8R3S6_ISOPI|nr:50S ribosomal protein L23 [Isosphaera pallida]ADV62661.1 LSU ribosomal protein L23P [Isosphaera pallida ATCC 43644]